MHGFKPDNINEAMSLPDDLREMIPEEHFVHSVVALVDAMDLSEIEERYLGTPGQAAYSRKALLRVILYAHWDKVLSSRKIAQAIKENIMYMYLAGGETPEYRTIIDFKNEYKELIENTLARTIQMAEKLNMVKSDSVSFDGTFIKANASKSSLIDGASLELAHELIKSGYAKDLMENDLFGDDIDSNILDDFSTKV
jgi:transposase